MASSNTQSDGISAADLAIIAAVVVVIGDILALWAVLKAKAEDDEEAVSPAVIGRKRSGKRS